jgi:hypothetical protein
VFCYLVKGCAPGFMRDILSRASAWKASLPPRQPGPQSDTEEV